jgi:hypothetical protein
MNDMLQLKSDLSISGNIFLFNYAIKTQTKAKTCIKIPSRRTEMGECAAHARSWERAAEGIKETGRSAGLLPVS